MVNRTGFDSLSAEIIQHIFGYVDSATLWKVAGVCRTWRAAAQEVQKVRAPEEFADLLRKVTLHSSDVKHYASIIPNIQRCLELSTMPASRVPKEDIIQQVLSFIPDLDTVEDLFELCRLLSTLDEPFRETVKERLKQASSYPTDVDPDCYPRYEAFNALEHFLRGNIGEAEEACNRLKECGESSWCAEILILMATSRVQLPDATPQSVCELLDQIPLEGGMRQHAYFQLLRYPLMWDTWLDKKEFFVSSIYSWVSWISNCPDRPDLLEIAKAELIEKASSATIEEVPSDFIRTLITHRLYDLAAKRIPFLSNSFYRAYFSLALCLQNHSKCSKELVSEIVEMVATSLQNDDPEDLYFLGSFLIKDFIRVMCRDNLCGIVLKLLNIAIEYEADGLADYVRYLWITQLQNDQDKGLILQLFNEMNGVLFDGISWKLRASTLLFWRGIFSACELQERSISTEIPQNHKERLASVFAAKKERVFAEYWLNQLETVSPDLFKQLVDLGYGALIPELQ